MNDVKDDIVPATTETDWYTEKILNPLWTSIDIRLKASEAITKLSLYNHEKTTTLLVSAIEKTIIKIELLTSKHSEAVNELRLILSNQINTFITRTEIVPTFQVLTEDITTCIRRLDKLEAKHGGMGSLAHATAIGLSLLVALASLVLVFIR